MNQRLIDPILLRFSVYAKMKITDQRTVHQQLSLSVWNGLLSVEVFVYTAGYLLVICFL